MLVTPAILEILFIAALRLFSLCLGTLCNNISAEFLTKGTTEAIISADKNIEQAGSVISQPLYLIKRVEITTPTLPNVSANTCRKIPYML